MGNPCDVRERVVCHDLTRVLKGAPCFFSLISPSPRLYEYWREREKRPRKRLDRNGIMPRQSLQMDDPLQGKLPGARTLPPFN